MMSVHLKLLVGEEDRPLFDGAVLDGGSEPLLVAAFLAFCATDILSTSKNKINTKIMNALECKTLTAECMTLGIMYSTPMTIP
jgi:hypothetical protein